MSSHATQRQPLNRAATVRGTAETPPLRGVPAWCPSRPMPHQGQTHQGSTPGCRDTAGRGGGRRASLTPDQHKGWHARGANGWCLILWPLSNRDLDPWQPPPHLRFRAWVLDTMLYSKRAFQRYHPRVERLRNGDERGCGTHTLNPREPSTGAPESSLRRFDS